MPTYEYICTKCGHEFESFQSISEAPVKTCPKCGGPVERKISGGAGLIFKGSGFYITDYKKSGAKKSPEADSKQPDSNPKSDTANKPAADSKQSKSSAKD